MEHGAKRTTFEKLLKKKSLKMTHERGLLFDEVLKVRKHFDADGLYNQLKEKGLRISRDTVYRTLPLLLECGVIQKSVGVGHKEYFEGIEVHGHHDHMICIDCGKVIEFHSQELEALQEKICKAHNFYLNFHDHRLFGYCGKCVKN